jgi:hypothetical protein
MMHRAVQHGLNDMRAAGYPGGLPPLLHLIRSVAGNFLDSSPDMRPSASSLMLVHAMPASADDVAPTTRKFYLSNQRMDAKTAAIAAGPAQSWTHTPRPEVSPRRRGRERKLDASATESRFHLTHAQQMLKILTHTHPFIGFVGYATGSRVPAQFGECPLCANS